ncbi:unnamed protein product [Owenia fusiformis]|uniref:Uncharacterized protein n=1 Tax=Owenia fusiformis TaxID=6347 RepID=A0A8J1UI69_OWEFU|nr:unnamed protein product [Owenia fusiformis]
MPPLRKPPPKLMERPSFERERTMVLNELLEQSDEHLRKLELPPLQRQFTRERTLVGNGNPWNQNDCAMRSLCNKSKRGARHTFASPPQNIPKKYPHNTRLKKLETHKDPIMDISMDRSSLAPLPRITRNNSTSVTSKDNTGEISNSSIHQTSPCNTNTNFIKATQTASIENSGSIVNTSTHTGDNIDVITPRTHTGESIGAASTHT